MDGWVADQQGGRSDGTFLGDGEPGTLNGGEEQDLPLEWLVSRCSAEVKQQGAVQRLGLGSRLQQDTVLKDSRRSRQRFSS